MTETTHQTVGIIRPEAVAVKLAAIRNHEYPELLAQITAQPRLAEMMWFLEYTSMQPGGLVKFCADMLEQMPGRFGTETMRAAKRPEYSLEEKHRIVGEVSTEYRPVFIQKREREALWREVLNPEPVSKETLANERWEFEQFVKSWTAQEVREVCHRAAAEILPRYLEDLCVQPDKGFVQPSAYSLNNQKSPYWFMDDPVAAVFEMMDRRAKEVSKHLAMTAVSKKVFDALDYALQEKVMVRIEGDSRFGKTESIEAWASMRPGLARVVNVPSSNSVADLLRKVAEAMGIAAKYGTRAQVLRERVEYVLQQSRLFLILDEAAFLIPQNYTAETAPARLNWVRTEIVDRGLPLALAVTPQSFLPAVDRFVRKTGFAMQQFFGRTHRVVQLPDELEEADMIAVAQIHFPEMGDEYLALIADLARLSENYLQTVDAVAKLARYIARREGHRRITVSDIETAASEVIPRRAVPVRDSARDTAQQSAARQAPRRAVSRPLQAPLKCLARAVQPSRIQPAAATRPTLFSMRGARPESVETGLVEA
jgi:AAA domain